jgi:DNA-binding IclR family transcriptional regulator
MLAFLPEDEVRSIIGMRRWHKLTDQTIASKRELFDELRLTRERGYAINDQQVVAGVRGVAAPIFGVSGRPVAAVNISVVHPVTLAQLEQELAPQVVATAATISELATQLAVDVG